MKTKLSTLMYAKVALGAVLLLQPFMSNAQIIDTSEAIITYDSSDYQFENTNLLTQPNNRFGNFPKNSGFFPFLSYTYLLGITQ
jgi:hypothetical protein